MTGEASIEARWCAALRWNVMSADCRRWPKFDWAKTAQHERIIRRGNLAAITGPREWPLEPALHLAARYLAGAHRRAR